MNILITWEKLEIDETGAYNEAYLAELRKQLKAEEKQGRTVTLELQLDRESAPPWLRDKTEKFFQDEDLQTRYIEAAAHCRRRLKNCKALEGWKFSSPRTGPEAEMFKRRLMERITG
jgi:hypothetical protein